MKISNNNKNFGWFNAQIGAKNYFYDNALAFTDIKGWIR